MMVFGLPSAKISAAPDAADNMPRVTMKSVIRPREMISPLTRPTRSPVTTAATTAASRPASNTIPKITAASVIADAIDRSIPAVATTNVCPMASTIRMADDVSIDVRLPEAQERRVERLEDDRQDDQGDRRRPGGQVRGVQHGPPAGRCLAPRPGDHRRGAR